MTWTLLILKVLEWVGPLFRAWLEELFYQGGKDLNDTPEGYTPELAYDRLFDAAQAKLGWFDWTRRAVLRILRRQVAREARALWQAAEKGTAAPVMSGADQRELASALGL